MKVDISIVCVLLHSLWVVDASSPVVLWTLKRIGEGNVESNLNEFSAPQFADLLAWKSEQGNIPIIAFGMNSLSLEDLTPQSSIGGTEPFRKLRRITEASAETLLVPSVRSAGDSISLLHSKGFQVHQINAGDPLPKLESPNSILIINEVPSVSMDDEILRVFSKYTLDFPNLVGMLWGKKTTWTEEPEDELNELSRKKRQAPGPEMFVYNDQNGLLVVFREVILTIFNKGEAHPLSLTKVNATATHPTNNLTTLVFDFEPARKSVTTNVFKMTMHFNKTNQGYYLMGAAKVDKLSGEDSGSFNFENVQLASAVQMVLPLTWSFHCSKFGKLYPRDRKTDDRADLKADDQTHTFGIDFIGFQVQAFRTKEITGNKFEDAYECVGFFTPGIWSGIFVTIILLSILSWGMKMIMDVRTMDRFDDPKGKPISFGSSE